MHTRPSKGKKRKRPTNESPDDLPRPSVPSIGSHVLVGLNSVTRHLESLAGRTAPPTSPAAESTASEQDSNAPANDAEKLAKTSIKPLSLVILTHPQPSLSPSHAHIPTLLHLATLQANPEGKPSEQTRLVCLPTSNDSRLAAALHIPRVGAIGVLRGAPGAKALEEYVTKHVGLTECTWVDEALKPEWRGPSVQQT